MHSSSGVGKAEYFELCEALGTPPVDEEIPIDREDLFYETRWVLSIYDDMPDKWNTTAGVYMGKDMTILPLLFKLDNTPNYIKRYLLQILPVINKYVTEDINRQIKSKAPKEG